MAAPTLTLVNGRQMPIVGIGTFTVTDEKALEEALDTALETGYRHIDTAYVYKNEHIIGRVLKKWFDSGKLKREDLFITTKLPPSGVHPDRVENYLTQSLKDLQLDYVDLYLIHFAVCLKPNEGPVTTQEPEPTDHIAVWKKLEEQVDLGRIKSIGLSNFNKSQVEKVFNSSRIKPAALQVELHVYLQQPELVKFCQGNGIVVTSYFSLGNNGLKDFIKKQGRPVNEAQQENLLQDPTVLKIAEKHSKSAAQILLKFLVQKNIIVIPKSVTPKRIKENFDLFDFTLDSGDIKALEELDKGENGRRGKFDFSPAIVSHPEYPFK